MVEERRIQDRYVLEEPLGEGGMAEVWRAQDERLERPVAIKFLSPHLTDDPEFLVRFFSEAQTVAAISHPNVVGVLDFGQHEGRPYLVMECLEGGAVAGLVGEPLVAERTFEIVEEAARGASAAHEVDLIHRDIKPGNILLDGSGRAKLADFGISSSTSSERLTQTGTTIGSPHYISPEQVAGQTATPRSDVYSLGIVLYELLTGRKPIDADNVTAVAIAQVDRMPVPPSDLNPDLDPEVDAIVMRCLAKDPDQRYQSAKELAGALAAYRAGIPASSAFAASGLAASHEVEEPAASGPRRSLIGASIVVLLLLAAGGAVIAGGNVSVPPGEAAEGSPVEKQPEVELTFSTESPTPSASSAPAVATEEEGSKRKPKPTPSDEPTEEAKEEKKTDEPQASPTPDPTPTAEPSPEPSPTSDQEQEPEPSPTSGTGSATSPSP